MTQMGKVLEIAGDSITVLATTKLRIVGLIVSLDGWILEPSMIQKVLDWPVPTDVSNIHGFLGTAGGSEDSL